MIRLTLTPEEYCRGEAWLLGRFSRILPPHLLHQLPGLSVMTEAEITSLPGFPEPQWRMQGAADAFDLDEVLAWWRTQRPEPNDTPSA